MALSRIKNAVFCRVHLTQTDKRNQIRILMWMFVWMVAWLGTLNLVRNEIVPQAIPAYVLALPSALLGLGMLNAFRVYLGQADELRRKIELDALAPPLASLSSAGSRTTYCPKRGQ